MEIIVTKEAFNDELIGKAVMVYGASSTTAFEGEVWLVKNIFAERLHLTGILSSHEEITIDDITSGNIELTILEVPSRKVNVAYDPPSPFEPEEEFAPSPFELEDRWNHNKTKILHRIVDIDYDDNMISVCPISDSNNIRNYDFEHFQKEYTFYTSYKGDN